MRLLGSRRITEPGLQNQSPTESTRDGTRVCESGASELIPQLTPESGKQAQIDTSLLPPDLTEIVAAWPKLPDVIRSAILTIVRNSIGK